MEGLQTGRIVHVSGVYQDRHCRAAVITEVWSQDGVVNVYIFPDGLKETGGVVTSVPSERNVLPANSGNPCWHWPEKV